MNVPMRVTPGPKRSQSEPFDGHIFFFFLVVVRGHFSRPSPHIPPKVPLCDVPSKRILLRYLIVSNAIRSRATLE